MHILVPFLLCLVLTLDCSTGWDQKKNVRKNPNETKLTEISHKTKTHPQKENMLNKAKIVVDLFYLFQHFNKWVIIFLFPCLF